MHVKFKSVSFNRASGHDSCCMVQADSLRKAGDQSGTHYA